MTRVRYLILLSLVLAVSGCFLGRKAEPLTDIDVIEESIAILPVIPEHIVMAVEFEKEYAKMAKKTNSVLDILAKGKNSKLLGPKKVKSSLEGMADTERLNLWLDELGEHSKPWMTLKLFEIGEKLKVEKIIRVKLDVLISSDEMGRWTDIEEVMGGIGKHWRGWVDVTADLFDLSPPRHVASSTGSAEYWGKTGLEGMGGGTGCCVFPIAIGETKIRAFDQAARAAIAGVLWKSAEGYIESDPFAE